MSTHTRLTVALAGIIALAIPASAANAVQRCGVASPAQQRSAAATVTRLRQSAGLGPVRPSATLSETAAAQACAMAARGRMAHSGGGRGPGPALKKAGYRWTVVSENVAAGPWDLGEVMGAWFASSRHLSNMMIPQTRDMGIAVATGSDGRTQYWAAVFAARR